MFLKTKNKIIKMKKKEMLARAQYLARGTGSSSYGLQWSQAVNLHSERALLKTLPCSELDLEENLAKKEKENKRIE